MTPRQADGDPLLQSTRRHFFRDCGLGLGSIALGSLLASDVHGRAPEAGVNPMRPRPGHHEARAKSVIYLFMAGGPSQLDLFDYKPELNRRSGQPIPESFVAGRRFAFMD